MICIKLQAFPFNIDHVNIKISAKAFIPCIMVYIDNMQDESDHDMQYYSIMSAVGQGVAASQYAEGKWILEYVNPALCSLLCMSADYLIGKSIDEFYSA